MKHRLNFITGVALLIVAATLAVFVVLRGPDRAGPPVAGSDREMGQGRLVSRSSARPRLPVGQPPRVIRPGLGVRIDPQDPDHPRLEALAKQVEAHALAQLARLTEELQLSVAQQRRIFPKLVQGSQSYHPSMRIVGAAPHGPVLSGGGGSAGEGLGDLAAELDPQQQDELLESSLDDLLLWREIIANLERQLEEQTGAVESPDQAEPEVPAAPSGGNRNLFDLVPPGK